MVGSIVGDKVKLRPATLQDRKNIFLWLTRSNLTEEMLGPPKYPDSPPPSWESFILDYPRFYFDGSRPTEGQCFIIEATGKETGQINYNRIDPLEKSTSIDIWLNDKTHAGKGYGPDAIKTLCTFLFKKFDCNRFVLSPSKRNTRAIRSYMKAGFIMTDEVPDPSEMDYDDNVIMVKRIDD